MASGFTGQRWVREPSRKASGWEKVIGSKQAMDSHRKCE
jgi:hypothetical protein